MNQDPIGNKIKENGLFCRQTNILNSFSNKDEIFKSEGFYESEDALKKAYPSETHEYYEPSQVHKFLEDLKKGSEEEIAKGKEDFSKLEKKIVVSEGQRKVVYVKAK